VDYIFITIIGSILLLVDYIFITINFSTITYTQGQKIEKPNNLKVFWSNKTKHPKQVGKNHLRSVVPEGD
jgi:hypothetical protein